MRVKSEEQRSALREGGRRLARIVSTLAAMVAPGVSTDALDVRARALAESGGDRAAFLGYTPHGAPRPYPAAICVSVNDEVVHGIPNESPRTLEEGDIVTIDMGLVHGGLVTDMAVTVPVGSIDERTQKLVASAREALAAALAAAREGSTTGDIGHAVQAVAGRYGFSVPLELGGHGVGRRVHEAPFIPNTGAPGSGARLSSGMVLAIEPIIIEGEGAVTLDSDGYTYRTLDGSRAAQFEHTVLVGSGDPEVLTESSQV